MNRGSRVVFVGNIPYDATNEEMTEIFNEVGPVASFRTITDRETGKPKGYGFCEYRDEATAMSAMRNLNGYDFKGRNLRVDYADQDRQEKAPAAEAGASSSTSAQPHEESKAPHLNVPQDPVGVALSGMTPKEIYEAMVDMKKMVQDDPEGAHRLLVDNPALAMAIMRSQVVLGMIKAPSRPQHPGRPMPAAQGHEPPRDNNLPSGMDAQYTSEQRWPGPPPNVTAGAGNIPPQQQAQEMSASQRQVLQQVLKLSEAQIAQLPPQQRDLALSLRRKVEIGEIALT